MDANRFDDLSRALPELGSRRTLWRVLAALPVAAALARLLGLELTHANTAGIGGGNRRRRKRKRKHRRERRRRGSQKDRRKHKDKDKDKNKKRKRGRKAPCKPESPAQTCAGRCGIVENNCQIEIDCGPCLCEPACPVCLVCNEASGVCEPDPSQVGEDCGEPGQGQICQPDGLCACDAASCPACAACQGDGTCGAPCDGCCDSGTCLNDTTNELCGSGGETCVACDDDAYCIDGACVVPPCIVCPSASECPFTSVQAAIEAADADDTITICAGIYVENLDISENLTLIGAGEDATILRGDGTASVVHLSTATVAIRDLTITGGNSDQFGGGIVNRQTLALTGVTVTGNTASSGGGIINSGALTLTSCTVNGNIATGQGNEPGLGGGIYNSDGATLELMDCTVNGNTADAGGGGIFNFGGDVIVTGGAVSGNSADAGGGIYNEEGMLTLTGCTVSGNTIFAAGGGILSNGTLLLIDCTVSGNMAGGEGGGIANAAGDATVTGGAVSGNTALRGGGIFNNSGAVPGTLTLTGGATVNNVNSAENGGGIYNFGVVTLQDNATVTGNHANVNGGGILNDGFAGSGFGTSTCSGGSSVIGNTAGTSPASNDCVAVNGGSCDAC